MPALPAPCNIKGIYLMHVGAYLAENHGPEALERIACLVPPEAAKILRSPFGHEWYPLTQVVAIELAILKTFYRGDPAECARLGRYDLSLSLNTVYRFLLRLLNQDTLLLKSGRLWSNFNDGGRLVAEKTSPNTGVIQVLDFNPVHVAHCHEIRGAFIGALEVCNTRDPKVEHTACVLDGAPACRYEARW